MHDAATLLAIGLAAVGTGALVLWLFGNLSDFFYAQEVRRDERAARRRERPSRED